MKRQLQPCPKCHHPCQGNSKLCAECHYAEKVQEWGELNTLCCLNCGHPYHPDASWCADCGFDVLSGSDSDGDSDSGSLQDTSFSEFREKKTGDSSGGDSKIRIKELTSTVAAEQNSGRSYVGPGYDDVYIVVQNKIEEPLYAHKFILSRKSPVFRKIFEDRQQDAPLWMVKDDDSTIPVMRAVINYCYNAEIKFSHDVPPEDVFKAAHKYGIYLLRKTCVDYMIRSMSISNLPRRIKLATKLNSRQLKRAASKCFKKHFDDVVWDVLKEFLSP